MSATALFFVARANTLSAQWKIDRTTEVTMSNLQPQQIALQVLSKNLIRKAFPNSFDKGSDYQRAGRVRLLDYDQDGAEGLVAGSQKDPYEVEVDLFFDGSRYLLDGSCNCPVGFDCKHIVALALSWLDKLRAPPPIEPFVVDPNAPIPEPSNAAGAWQQWLQSAQHLMTPRSPPILRHIAKTPEKIIYLLVVKEQELLINPVRVNELKNGKFGVGKSIRLPFSRAYEQAQQLELERDDRMILLSLSDEELQFRKIDGWYPITDDTFLLEQIIRTGRARYALTNGVQINAGKARALRLQWDEDDEGTQHLRGYFGKIPAEIFGLDLNYYFDPASGEIGELEANDSAQILPLLQHMPVVLPSQIAAAKKSLQQLGLEHLAAGIRQLQVSTQRVSVPRARLIVSRDIEHVLDGKIHLNAQLQFLYDGQVVEANDKRERLRQRRGDHVVEVLREPQFEAVVMRYLAQHKFRPLQAWTYININPGRTKAHLWLAESIAEERLQSWLNEFSIQAKAFAIDVLTTSNVPAFLGITLDESPELELRDEANDWFEVRLGIKVDGQTIDLLPILLRALQDPEAFSEQGLRVELPDGRQALIPAARVDTLRELVTDLQINDGIARAPRAILPALVPPSDWRFFTSDRTREFLEQLKSFQGLEKIQLPKEFNAILRPYQLDGVAWLDFLRRFQFGGVLADDMGLGKTVQVLAYLSHEKSLKRLKQPTLVVCPASVAPNWAAECARFAPDLRVNLLLRGNREFGLKNLADSDLVITNYSLLLRDINVLQDQSWSMIVFDEAQWLKNQSSQAYRAALKLKSPLRVGLTGTPVENHLGELKAQFDLTFPGLLGDTKSFAKRFRYPIEKQQDPDVAEQLRKRIRPFLLRRTKAEVAADLPPRTLITQRVELDDAQRDLYETVRLQMEKRVRDALRQNGLAKSHITVLDALLKLRQICCDPALIKLPSAAKVQQSAKREALNDLLPTLLEEGRTILLFSQFTEMLDLIEADQIARGQSFVRLDGSTRDRALPVRRFQAGEVPLFLISLKAGGVGLNLTRADTVVMYDPWWNPAAEAQAIDRAHRIGQDKPVFVHELICAGTVEEKMQQLKIRKRAIADAVLRGENNAMSQLEADDLMALFAADI